MADVLIAGAGPTGLVLALWLAKAGVAVRIVDRAAEPGQTSRAIGTQARTLEYYRMLGLAEEVVVAGARTDTAIIHEGREIVGRLPLGDFGAGLSAFPFLLFFPQDEHERLLIAALAREGVTVERPVELVGFTETAAGIEARLARDGEEEIVFVRYLAACDGAHSTVRHQLDVPFEGATTDVVFFVADVETTEGADRLGLHMCIHPGGFGLFMPLRGGSAVRFIGVVPPQLQGKSGLRFEDVGQELLAQSGMSARGVNWFSTYRINHRVAHNFRRGRVFLLGDAGHVHSPAGAQGMNTGIGDAVNLGWKLADVLAGGADPALLDTYEPERRAFAIELVKRTDRGFGLVAGGHAAARVMRGLFIPKLLPRLMRLPAFGRGMFRLISQIGISYRNGPLGGAGGRVRPGDRLPWVNAGADDNFSTLDGRWRVQVYGAPAPGTIAGFPAHALPFGSESRRRGLVQGAQYLLRPDGHIAVVGAPGAEGEASIAAFAGRWKLGPGEGRDAAVP